MREGKGREVVCGQVWWPILGICPLHLTHPSAHSQQWTHTRSSGQPYCGARGAVGGSVPCSRVSPQSWYWRWREHLLFTPPTDNPCRTWESNLQPLGYKSNSLTIRPRLPPLQSPLPLKDLSPSGFVYLLHGSLLKLICQKPHTTTGRQSCFSPVLSLLRQAFICLGISHYCRCWGGRKWRWRFSGGR